MNLLALAGGALACVVAPLLVTAFIPELVAGARAFLAIHREPAARIVASIAGAAAFGSSVITAGVALAEPLPRQPGDVLYLPSLAIRADGRLALAEGVTLAAAARAYAGPGDYWSSTCRATLPGWRWPVDWQALDAIGRPLWRATFSDRGVATVAGLGPAEADPLRALLEELSALVACGE